jgi:DNA polymerase V
VSAGFPSPADDYAEGALDLNTHLVSQPAATFFARARGDSMIGAGIHDGDLLVVDRSLTAEDGKVVVVSINGELTVKRMRREKGSTWLASENPDYPSIEFQEQDEAHLWGVVTSVIHSL